MNTYDKIYEVVKAKDFLDKGNVRSYVEPRF